VNLGILEAGFVLVMDLIMIFVCPFSGGLLIVAGRARKGPAPLNLEIPEYDFADENTLIIG
jgi:Rieske Fe-S protein